MTSRYKKFFLILLIAGLLSVLAVLPYAFTLQQSLLQNAPFPLPVLALLSFVQSGLLMAVAIALGLRLALPLGFNFPVLDWVFFRRGEPFDWGAFARLPVLLGVLAGLAIFLGDWLFQQAGVVFDVQYTTGIPIWMKFLASFYGGIGEEILMRLFLVSLLVWLFARITRSQEPLARGGLVWTAIAIVAVIFGLGHLPATAAVIEITPLVIARAIALNGIGGLVFGWLYWKRGLEAAMLSHFSTDLMILIVLPALLGI